MADLFDKIRKNMGPLGQYFKVAHGYYTFPKLEGDISNRMQFRGKEVLVWSLNNYLGLANHPEVRKADADAAAAWGLAYPMGARMMTGESKYHEELEQGLAELVGKKHGMLLNYGYQGCMSVIDALVNRHDVIVYDAESHACIVDGVRLHAGHRFVYRHNDIESLEKQLQRAEKLTEKSGGGILVITEGVFGMTGEQGKIKEIVDLKSKYNFRLFVDDAHGIGALGPKGGGAIQEQGAVDGVDVIFGTFAKSFALTGAWVAGDADVIMYLKYNVRSQIYAKSLPMPLVIGALKRLEIMNRGTELKDKLWAVVNRLQKGLREAGFDLGKTNSCVTPVMMHGGEAEASNLVVDLRENYGIFCSMVIYPVIPKGMILLRLIPTAVHTFEDVDYTIKSFSEVRQKLIDGKYDKVNHASLLQEYAGKL
ncbi:MAG: aminotransferase class I/II-fold pyridoxal phosphate-dependent enzyme [Flavobacteriales bacterium]|nr:aminotransferase class I/II-fold pyridoxal phosphate-dependent enzyme [Flavobacteriales bacterium]